MFDLPTLKSIVGSFFAIFGTIVAIVEFFVSDKDLLKVKRFLDKCSFAAKNIDFTKFATIARKP